MITKIIIDADNAVFGRLCSYAAKKALEGNEIIIVNSENTVITGNKKDIIKRYDSLRRKGGKSLKGPRYVRFPYKMLKWCIRGMLPDHRKGQGKQAFSRVRCYEGIPEEFKDEKKIKMQAPKNSKYMQLKELAQRI
jgi:large subunit ribosomal protein L13